jgi:hypothetical protein
MALSLTKSNAASVATARQHLLAGNPGGYARLLSATIRAAGTTNQIRALWNVVTEDGTDDLFDYTVAGSVLCPLAKQVAA